MEAQTGLVLLLVFLLDMSACTQRFDLFSSLCVVFFYFVTMLCYASI